MSYVYVDDYDDYVPEPECPECGGPGIVLGSLGVVLWHRCRNCGTDFYQEEQ